MIWTVVPRGLQVECGGCDGLLVSDQPYAKLTRRELPRCRDCAERQGFTYDPAAVDRERVRLDALAAAAPTLPPVRPSTAHRYTLRRPMKASEIAGAIFDSKLAAAGRHD